MVEIPERLNKLEEKKHLQGHNVGISLIDSYVNGLFTILCQHIMLGLML